MPDQGFGRRLPIGNRATQAGSGVEAPQKGLPQRLPPTEGQGQGELRPQALGRGEPAPNYPEPPSGRLPRPGEYQVSGNLTPPIPGQYSDNHVTVRRFGPNQTQQQVTLGYRNEQVPFQSPGGPDQARYGLNPPMTHNQGTAYAEYSNSNRRTTLRVENSEHRTTAVGEKQDARLPGLPHPVDLSLGAGFNDRTREARVVAGVRGPNGSITAEVATPTDGRAAQGAPTVSFGFQFSPGRLRR